jgi:beta-lactam-binding protein with PASTA domain
MAIVWLILILVLIVGASWVWHAVFGVARTKVNNQISQSQQTKEAERARAALRDQDARDSSHRLDDDSTG